eukprot:Phypoly_transcript_18231.p1 GENE.Phypoly_transcript_18231~~Phypoly_transcript_18231.p1  ORF type:complete len:223 (+),score=32.15 Phypoly_transcript_18231:53-721(+)
MATIDVANNMSFFPTSYSADGQATNTGSYGNYPASSNYMQSSSSGSYQTGFEEEPPLLEELGINFAHIRTKSLSVLNPLKKIDSHIMDDTDLAGPLFFALVMGVFLLLNGKIHFGYIYGMGGLGCVAMYIILNLMCEQGIDIYRVISVLGYCLLPMVFLAFFSIPIPLNGFFGFILAALCIGWCTHSAALMFVKVLSLVEQRLLVAYPIGLLYTCFALLAIF